MTKKLTYNAFQRELGGLGLSRSEFSSRWKEYKVGTSLDVIRASIKPKTEAKTQNKRKEITSTSKGAKPKINSKLLTAVSDMFSKKNYKLYYDDKTLLNADKVAIFDLLIIYYSDLIEPLVNVAKTTIKIPSKPKTTNKIAMEIYEAEKEKLDELYKKKIRSGDEDDQYGVFEEEYYKILNDYIYVAIKQQKLKTRQQLDDFYNGPYCNDEECCGDGHTKEDGTYIQWKYNIVAQIEDECMVVCDRCARDSGGSVEAELNDKIRKELESLLAKTAGK